ncbi:tape measure protein [Gordonia sp. HY442]|uniref:tape measure protein n=1 Tax=Gordonia zhenghanii TaxID=2911516 RepID=UPI001F38D332|nr:tape measure protein [Gordonia zhenghanii]MCF8605156.1 tape measure protein [Gordonia zhenghanii]
MAESSRIYIPVLGSFRGMGAQFSREISGAAQRSMRSATGTMESQGREMGRRAGSATAQGLASQRKQIERVSRQLASARSAEADAAGAVRVAEQKLADLRSRSNANATQVARAEEQLASARRGQSSAQASVMQGERQLEQIRNRQPTKAAAVLRAEQQVLQARNRAADAVGKIRIAEAQLAQARTSGDQTKIVRAEESLARARRNSASANDQVRSRELLLRSAQEDSAAAARRAATASDQSSGAARRSAAANDQSAGAARRAGAAHATAAPQVESFGSRVLTSARRIGFATGAFLGLQGAVGVLKSGFDRINTLQKAEIQFQNLGLTAAQSKRQMADLTQIVTGTSTSLSDAAGSAAMLGGAGVQSGKDLNEAMKALVNVSAASGASASDIGLVMMQIKASGKLMGSEALQLAQRGIAVYDMIAKSTGKTTAEIRKMGEEGKISFEMVVGALNKGTGNLAKEMGQTLPAKLANLKTSMATAAAALITPMIGPLTTAVTTITAGFKAITPVIGPVFSAIGTGFKEIIGVLTTVGGFVVRNKEYFIAFGAVLLGLLSPMLALSAAFKIARLYVIAYGIAQRAAAAATVIMTAAQNGLKAAFLTNPVGLIIAGIIALVAAIVIAYKKSETFRNIVQVMWEWIKKAAVAVKDGLVAAFNWLKDAITPVVNFIKRFWQILLFGLGPIGMIIGVVVQLVKHWDTVKAVFMTVWNVIKPILNGIWKAIQIIGGIVGAVIIGTVIVAWNALKTTISMVWMVIKPIFDLFVAIVKMIGAVAMWLWQSAIMPAFNGIKIVIGVVWTIIKGYINAWIMVFRTIATVATWLWQTIFVPVFNGIKMAAQFMWQGISVVFGWIKSGMNVVGTVISTVANAVIMPVWNAIKTAASVMWGALKTVFDWIKAGWEALGKGIGWVVDNIIKPAFNGIKSALQSVKDFFGQIVDGIGVVWDKVKGFVAAPINFVIQTVWNDGLRKGWNVIAGFLPGLSEMQPLSPVRFAEGGPVPYGSGAKRGKDSVHALLMPDEHVWDVADVRKSGGQGAMYRMRSMVDSGQPFTWTPRGVGAAAEGGPLRRFKDGGAVEAGQKLAPLGGEGGLQPIAVLMRRIIFRLWKNITDIGGYRADDPFPEHPSGRALDVMIPDMKTGDEVNAWTHANSPKFPIEHTIWKQRWRPMGNPNGEPMEDRGSPTQNHMDHVHTWYKPQSVDPNVVPEGLVGYDGLSDEDRKGILKKKITEILDKLLDPIKKGMGAVIGTPPPSWLGIPPTVLDQTKTKAVDALFATVEKLGDKLKDAYNKAKDIGEIVGKKIVTGLTFGLVRDTGGYLPKGQSVVTNETGKPEAVLNWDQLELLKKLLELAKETGESAVKSAGSEVADFFGFGTIYGKITEAVEARINENTQSQGGDAVDSTSQSGDAVDSTGQSDEAVDSTNQGTTGGGTYTAPSYGDPNARIGDETHKLDKMPELGSDHKYDPSKGVEQWRPMAIEAIKRVGLSTAKDQVDAMLSQIQSESGGDPNISQQITDVNGTGDAAGVGLLQIIPGTFAAHRDPALPDDRRNPFANMVAALRYYKSRYGPDLTQQWGHGHGYDSGGWLMPGPTLAVNKTRKPEAVLTASQWSGIDSMLEALPSAAEFKAAAAITAARPMKVSDADPDAAAAGGGREVHNHFHTEDVSEAVRKSVREQRRLARSDALVGGF